MQRRYVAVRGASLAGGAFQSWLGDILGSRPAAGGVVWAAMRDFFERGLRFSRGGRCFSKGSRGE